MYQYFKEDLAALKRIRKVYAHAWRDALHEDASLDNVETLVIVKVLDNLIEEYTDLLNN